MRTEREEHVEIVTQQKSLKRRDFLNGSDASSCLPPVDTLPLGNVPPNSSETRTIRTNAIVVIDSRSLTRDCLVRALRTITDTLIVSLPTVEAWLEVADKVAAAAILLCISGTKRGSDTSRQLALIEQISDHIPMLVLGETEDPGQIIEFLSVGFAATFRPVCHSPLCCRRCVSWRKVACSFLPAASWRRTVRPVRAMPQTTRRMCSPHVKRPLSGAYVRVSQTR